MRFSPSLLATALLLLPFTIHPPAARAANPPGSGLRAAGLRCEYLTDPLGIGETLPRLSWIDESPRRRETQSAYQILVASSAESLAQDQGDRWDSGKVVSDESAQIVYGGKPLGARAACFWKVRVWDRDGNPSAWSEPARWTMGLLAPEDWQARWIDARHPASPGATPAPAPAIIVQHATYETVKAGVSKDVTPLLAQWVQDHGAAPFSVDNDALGGDPAKDERKQLRVEFTRAGETVKRVVPENEALTFYTPEEPLRYLRKTFAVKNPVRQATLYVTALGLYECRLNGQRVGDAAIAPDWTDYRKRVRYQAYDVTALVQPGNNTLGALLAGGWYCGHFGLSSFQFYGKTPALLAQLELTHADGSVERIVSDGTWQSHASPVVASDLLLGESYDARKELPGWDRSSDAADANAAGDGQWTPAAVRDEPAARAVESQVSPPVRPLGERRTVAVTEPAPGRWTFDLGQNMVGVVRLKVSAPAGTLITLRHAEMLNPDGTVYTANLRKARSTDTYVCKGGGEETWQPRFTFHGFRYVELTGLTQQPSKDAVTGIVLGSDTPRAGTFKCSDARINQLVSNIEWGQRGNYLSVPTDCPQRDERLGWMGDAQVFVRTATENADIASFYNKWLVDVDDAQNADGRFSNVSPQVGAGEGTPAWADAGVICPWTIYEAYGDRRVLERHLPAMTRWVEWCREHSTGLLRDKARGSDFGDWLSIGAATPKDVIGTAYFAYSTHLLAQAYRAVGNEEGAVKYGALFADIREAFNRAYVAPDGRIKGDTQCVYAMALRFALLSEEMRARAVKYLADDVAAHGNHLTTGFVGVSYLLPVLSAGGRLDTAYTLLTQDTFPSWLFSVKQGATTIWERWDGWTPEKGFQTPSMNSFNHYSLGSCGEWLYATVAGIDGDHGVPGYKKLVLRPQPGGGIASVEASRRTMHGDVLAKWTAGNGAFNYEVTIPANTTARVILPTADVASVMEGGRRVAEVGDIRLAEPTENNVTLEVGSGTYRFTCRAPGQEVK